MEEEIIKDQEQVLVRVLRKGDFPSGLKFYTEDKDFVQVGTWSYDKGKQTIPHAHKIAERKAQRTQEVLYVKSGKVKMGVYSEQDKLVQEVILQAGDIAIVFGGGHSYEVLEDKTQVLEIKNGPYPGIEKDKRRITAGG